MKSIELKRTTLTLVAILVVYWGYSTAIVPWIEPAARRRSTATTESVQRGPRFADRYRPQLQHLFGAGSWQSASPKVLRHRNTLLLFEEYTPQKDGTLKLVPCSVILWRDGDQTVEEAASAVVLEAPEGAVLQLSKPINLRSGQLGQPVAGRLDGPIRIRSHGRQDGTGRLKLVTSNLQINARENFLWTPNSVDIEYEGHRAKGRDLTIKLVPPKARSDEGSKNSWAGMRSVELVQLDYLHLEVGSESDETGQMRPAMPVDVTCNGPLRVDFSQRFLTLEDNVRLRRKSEQGAVDTLTCEHLHLGFLTQSVVPPNAVENETQAANVGRQRWRRLPKLEVKNVVAEGNPVVLDVVSRDTQIQGRRISYDLKAGRFWLTPDIDDAADRVWLRQQKQQIETRELDCRLTPQGQIQQVVAKGPGRFRGLLTGDNAQSIETDWEESLVFAQESPALHRLEIRKQARVQIGETDGIAADFLQLWFEPDTVDRRAPASSSTAISNSLRIRPQRLVASVGSSPEPIILQSNAVIGTTQKLDVRFEHLSAVPTQPVSRTTPRTRNASLPQNPRVRWAKDTSSFASPADAKTITTRVAGQQLDVVLRVREGQISLANLILDHQVQLWQDGQTQTPFQLNAARVQVKEGESGGQVITALGDPVEIRSDLITLQTRQLYLDRQRNLVWTDRPGRMTVMVDRDAQGNPIANPQPITIAWVRRMDFDGQSVKFMGQVEVVGTDQRVRAEQVDVALNQLIRFDETRRPDKQIDIQQIRAQGNVHIDAREYEQEQLTSVTYLRVPFAQLDRESGALLAGGPGRVITVRDGFQSSVNRVTPSSAFAASKEPPNDLRKTFLQVDFQKEIRGNLNQRIVDFYERVKVVYGPVMTWNETLRADGPLNENEVLLSCEKLTVAQGTTQVVAPSTTIDLVAEGNTYVEGQSFTARGSRVSYEQGKDLLILEGAGNTDAVLSHQARAGATRSETAARKILYWPTTRRVQVDSAKYLDFGF